MVIQRLADRTVLALGLVILGFTVAGGPGWGAMAGDAVLATSLERSAQSPLYHVLASAAAALPIGEPGFRLAALSAVLGALMLVGVMRAARALLPADPIAGVVGAVLLALAPPWRDAAHLTGPAMLAGTGTVWALAAAAEHARGEPRRALAAFGGIAIVVGSAPWLGVALGLLLGTWVARTARTALVVTGAAGIGISGVVLWVGALGSLPALRADLGAAVTASGHGAAAVVVGTGLLGAAFAVATGLPHARWYAGALAIMLAHAILVDPDPTPLLGVLAIACAVLPAAIVRAVGVPGRRHGIAAGAGVPLVIAALLAGPGGAEVDAGDSPARLAGDLVGSVPPGPGAFVATRAVPWTAIHYAQSVAGVRPDLVLEPPGYLDVRVVNALRLRWVAASDAFAFGVIDPKRSLPRGRAFQMLRDPATVDVVAVPPAHYATPAGAVESLLLAVARARFEAGNGKLEQAARAAGLAGTRFSGSDLAILATTVPSAARPAFFGFVPALGVPPGPWLLDLVGDDLAWVCGLDTPPVSGPAPRALHARWVALWGATLTPEDPSIVALGPDAVVATRELLAAVKP